MRQNSLLKIDRKELVIFPNIRMMVQKKRVLLMKLGKYFQNRFYAEKEGFNSKNDVIEDFLEERFRLCIRKRCTAKQSEKMTQSGSFAIPKKILTTKTNSIVLEEKV